MIFNFVDREVPKQIINIAALTSNPALFTHLKFSSCFNLLGKTFADLSICKAEPIAAVSSAGWYSNESWSNPAGKARFRSGLKNCVLRPRMPSINLSKYSMSPAEPLNKISVSSEILYSYLIPLIVRSISCRQLSKTGLKISSCSPGFTFCPMARRKDSETLYASLAYHLSMGKPLSLSASVKLWTPIYKGLTIISLPLVHPSMVLFSSP